MTNRLKAGTFEDNDECEVTLGTVLVVTLRVLLGLATDSVLTATCCVSGDETLGTEFEVGLKDFDSTLPLLELVHVVVVFVVEMTWLRAPDRTVFTFFFTPS